MCLDRWAPDGAPWVLVCCTSFGATSTAATDVRWPRMSCHQPQGLVIQRMSPWALAGPPWELQSPQGCAQPPVLTARRFVPVALVCQLQSPLRSASVLFFGARQRRRHSSGDRCKCPTAQRDRHAELSRGTLLGHWSGAAAPSPLGPHHRATSRSRSLAMAPEGRWIRQSSGGC